MRVHQLHRKLRFHFKDYENKDVMKICNKIAKELKLKGKNPYEAVSNNWSQICQFLINWTGKKT